MASPITWLDQPAWATSIDAFIRLLHCTPGSTVPVEEVHKWVAASRAPSIQEAVLYLSEKHNIHTSIPPNCNNSSQLPEIPDVTYIPVLHSSSSHGASWEQLPRPVTAREAVSHYPTPEMEEAVGSSASHSGNIPVLEAGVLVAPLPPARFPGFPDFFQGAVQRALACAHPASLEEFDMLLQKAIDDAGLFEK